MQDPYFPVSSASSVEWIAQKDYVSPEEKAVVYDGGGILTYELFRSCLI